MISRSQYQQQLDRILSRSRIGIISGPRQCGKITLARQYVDESSANYFDLDIGNILRIFRNNYSGH